MQICLNRVHMNNLHFFFTNWVKTLQHSTKENRFPLLIKDAKQQQKSLFPSQP